MSLSPLLEYAERERLAAASKLSTQNQAKLGQYFTPVNTAQLIARMAELHQSGTIRVLDPGAGSGILTAALVNRILKETTSLKVEVLAIETDTQLIRHLETTLNACINAGHGRVKASWVNADFILDSTGLNHSLNLEKKFDLVIENPPYGKLGVKDTKRIAMRSRGEDAPNLYTAFLSLSIDALCSDGQLVAITPRSFFNGSYFKDFRFQFLDNIALRKIHVFSSRSSIFSDSGVLQENVIFQGIRGAQHLPVVLSESADENTRVTSRIIDYEDVIFPNDPHRFIRLPLGVSDAEATDVILNQPCSLEDLGIQVSTGKVVDFRFRDSLCDSEHPDAAPLIYPGNLRNGTVDWPRDIRKPQWFIPTNDKARKMLLPQGWYTLVKRFSAKEERRRVVASTWSPEQYPSNVAFENHLNIFHSNNQGIDEKLAKGIAVWMNSTFIDKFFRTFSGHTQVNATDLRTLRFPSRETLRSLGQKNPQSQQYIDEAVMELTINDRAKQ
ncbi:Eco57I restriction-modification methylase domain-containing protein [Mobiluncus mulieris]|uniref:Eco57I restriction-modification methylase domain-containing protein n=1 Tax=Mobiluncus mulieris TaxID=2052 RepID=UPI002431FE6B|nr:N-6 DNA methylase [Mobiluncus mulieris]